MDSPKLSVLVSARKNSKYLAKFLFGYFERTAASRDTELLVMMNGDDTWNHELVHFYRRYFPLFPVKFFTEDLGLGRGGLHEYFNELLKSAKGDWIVYFCEDHFITMGDWDMYIRHEISTRGLDPKEPWCIIPKFDNCGAMNQIVSRGYIEALGGVLGRHGWIDSYINDVNALAFPGEHNPRVIRLDRETFHDFTHDDPSPMSDAHMQSVTSDEGKKLPKYDSDEARALIQADAAKLMAAVEALNG